MEQKRSALLDVEGKEQEVQRKLLRVKSNHSNGNMCRNCHLRLKHIARNCEYEKCISVFRWSGEKLHPGEIDSRGTRLTIQKLKADIAKLERDRDLKEIASNNSMKVWLNKSKRHYGKWKQELVAVTKACFYCREVLQGAL